jgi:hypothetical protein
VLDAASGALMMTGGKQDPGASAAAPVPAQRGQRAGKPPIPAQGGQRSGQPPGSSRGGQRSGRPRGNSRRGRRSGKPPVPGVPPAAGSPWSPGSLFAGRRGVLGALLGVLGGYAADMGTEAIKNSISDDIDWNR